MKLGTTLKLLVQHHTSLLELYDSNRAEDDMSGSGREDSLLGHLGGKTVRLGTCSVSNLSWFELQTVLLG